MNLQKIQTITIIGVEKMIEILQYIAGMLFLSGMVLGVWTSTVMLGERKERYRSGTHDYYDNPINKKGMMKE
jgi:hypothetical protein